MTATQLMYQGIEVIARDPIVKCRHPRYGYGKLAVLKGASTILLADGVELVVCNDCGYNGITKGDPYVKPEGPQKETIYQADTILAHRSGTHNRTAPPLVTYTDDQVKTIIETWLKWKSVGVSKWTQFACDELDRLGVTPYTGGKWGTNQLGGVARKYLKKPKFKNLKAAPMGRSDREAIVQMVRNAATRAGGVGTHVADNVRITEKPSPGRHSVVAVEDLLSAEEEVTHVPNGPKLSFAAVDVIEEQPFTISPVKVATRQDSVAAPVASSALDSSGQYQHLAELATGEPMFVYGGMVMVGKEVKGVQV